MHFSPFQSSDFKSFAVLPGMSSPPRPQRESYDPPNLAPALDKDFLLACLPETLQNDINTRLSPLHLKELHTKESELLDDISSFLNSRITEFATFAANLVSNSTQKTYSQSADRALHPKNVSSLTENFNVLQRNENDKNSSEITSLVASTEHAELSSVGSALSVESSPHVLPLKSSLAKPKGRKKYYSKTVPEPVDKSKKKKVMFSNNDQITIVPSLEDLEQHYSSDEDSEISEEDEVVEEVETDNIEASPPPYEPPSDTLDSDIDDDFNSTVAATQQQFTAPLYSVSAYSSGLDSLECSPVQSDMIEQDHVETEAPHPSNELSYPKPETGFHTDVTLEVTSVNPVIETKILSEDGASAQEPPVVPSVQTATAGAERSPTQNDDSSSDELASRVSYMDDDDDDDVFQLDETLGVMPDTEDPPVIVESITFPSSTSAFRTQFSNSRSLSANYEFSPFAIPASLPSNQSRTTQSQLPTVVGSLRPRPMSKYKVGTGFSQNKLPPIMGSGSNSVESSLSSSAVGATFADRNRVDHAEVNEFQKSSNDYHHSGDLYVSNFASSLPIQISATSWGHLAKQAASKNAGFTEQNFDVSASRSFLNNDKILNDLKVDSSERMKGLETAVDADRVPGSSIGTGMRPDDPLLDEDISLYASPSSAAQIMNPMGIQPDQMSFSQRLMWERRSNPRH